MEPSENQALLVRTDAFGGYLRAEAARSRRYGHPFAVFVLRPPESPAFSEALAVSNISENLSALLTSGLVRECDVVSILEEQKAIGVILPETNVAGAGALLERLLGALSDPDHAWQVELFVYPEHQHEINELAKQAA
jgi:hypothetical protein